MRTRYLLCFDNPSFSWNIIIFKCINVWTIWTTAFFVSFCLYARNSHNHDTILQIVLLLMSLFVESIVISVFLLFKLLFYTDVFVQLSLTKLYWFVINLINYWPCYFIMVFLKNIYRLYICLCLRKVYFTCCNNYCFLIIDKFMF